MSAFSIGLEAVKERSERYRDLLNAEDVIPAEKITIAACVLSLLILQHVKSKKDITAALVQSLKIADAITQEPTSGGAIHIVK